MNFIKNEKAEGISEVNISYSIIILNFTGVFTPSSNSKRVLFYHFSSKKLLRIYEMKNNLTPFRMRSGYVLQKVHNVNKRYAANELRDRQQDDDKNEIAADGNAYGKHFEQQNEAANHPENGYNVKALCGDVH